jgi:hypothetical protein
MPSLLVFNIVYRLEIQSVMLVYLYSVWGEGIGLCGEHIQEL